MSKTKLYNETYTDLGFDTPISFQATCTPEQFAKYESILKDTFREYNEIFDQYHSYEGINNVYTLNQEAYSHPVKVDPAMIDCLDLAIKAGELDQRFDVSEGKVLSLWHDAREAKTPYVPSATDIEEAKKGLNNGYINAGGNVVLLGEKLNGKDWVIGIQSPDESDSVVQFVTKGPVVMVTSGDYQRYMEVDGKKYSHIIDPTTGYPSEYMRSVTVIDTHDKSAWADAMSTTLFCMPVKEGMDFCKANHLQAVWIVNLDQKIDGLVPQFTTDRYAIYCTDGLKDSLRLS